jgi:hypothetical protein
MTTQNLEKANDLTCRILLLKEKLKRVPERDDADPIWKYIGISDIIHLLPDSEIQHIRIAARFHISADIACLEAELAAL